MNLLELNKVKKKNKIKFALLLIYTHTAFQCRSVKYKYYPTVHVKQRLHANVLKFISFKEQKQKNKKNL